MNVFDKFFTKFAYKFDKGYPDMDNPKDVLLLENILKELIVIKLTMFKHFKNLQNLKKYIGYT